MPSVRSQTSPNGQSARPEAVENPMLKRVGIVAKSGLGAASDHLLEIGAWLRRRGAEPVFESETGALARAGADWMTATKDALPESVDLILVLAGDGTLLGMADRI